MTYKEYTEGMDMKQFQRVAEISYYNSNYYIGLTPYDLLYGLSDDDNTTEWYLIKNLKLTYLGESYCREDEKLHRYETPCT